MAKIDKNRLACEHFWGSVGPTSMPQIASSSSSFFWGWGSGCGFKNRIGGQLAVNPDRPISLDQI